MVTIKDIAKQAGVSVGTVSRVLNGGKNVRPVTYRRVIEVIQKNHYKPNKVARKLVMKHFVNNTVGAVIPNVTKPFFTEIVRGLYDTLRKADFNLFLFNVTLGKEKEILQHVSQENLRGVFVITIPISEEERNLLRLHNMEPILLEKHAPFVHSVWIDNFHGGKLAAEYLLSRKAKRIAFIGEATNNEQQRLRLEGFKSVIFSQPSQIEKYVEKFISTEEDIPFSSYGSQISDLVQGLISEENIDGFFFYCDEFAYPAIKFIRSKRLRVRIVGYDDIPTSEYLGLTTIRQSGYEIGQKGAELFLQMSKDKTTRKETFSIRLEPTLIIRET